MSLNKFHIIFISICSAMMVYFAYWSFINWKNLADNSFIVYFFISLVSLLVLIIYSKKFKNKFKGIS